MHWIQVYGDSQTLSILTNQIYSDNNQSFPGAASDIKSILEVNARRQPMIGLAIRGVTARLVEILLYNGKLLAQVDEVVRSVMFTKFSPSENARLFVTEKMPRDGSMMDWPVESYITAGRYSAQEVAIIREVIKDIMTRRPSKDYTVGTSGNTVWLNISRTHPKPFSLELQLYWKEPPF